MDYRKINSHIILLVATMGRLVALGQGADTGMANLVFLITLGVCVVIYLIIIAALSQMVIPWIMKKIPQKKSSIPADNAPSVDIGKIKEDADRQYLERHKARVNQFLEYAHIVMGPYITRDALSRLDKYIECYAGHHIGYSVEQWR